MEKYENNSNSFTKFVELHDKWRSKRHIQGDKMYSDYDTMAGFCIVMIPISFIFFDFFTGMIFVTLMFIFFALNYTEFNKKDNTIKEAEYREIK